MSIFFWKKKKAEPETAPAEPETGGQPAKSVEAEALAAEPSEEEPAAEEPLEEQPAAEEPAESVEAEAPAAEPSEEEPAEAEEPAEEKDLTQTQVFEPVFAEEPAEEKDLTQTQVFEPVSAEEPAEEKDLTQTQVFEPVSAEEPAEEKDLTQTQVFEPVRAEEPAEPAEAPAPAPEAPAPVQEQAAIQEDDDYEERRPRRRSRAWLWIFLLLLVIGGSYYYGIEYSRTHFLENTYINNMDVSGMTSPEVEKILSQKAKGYELKITFRDGEEEVISGSEIGFKVKPDGSVDRILQSQDHRKWFMCFFRRTDGEVEQKTTYDPVRLTEAVESLPELQKDYMVKPADAYIELQGTTFSIVPEIEGNLVDVEMVKKAAEEAVRSEEGLVEVAALEGSYSVPKVRAKDKDIVEKCKSYNDMLAGSITWNLPDGDTLRIDANTTVGWLSQDENGNYYRDEELWEDKIEFWVDELARKVNTVGKDWDFHATGVGDIEVSGGDYGYSVDKVSEREKVWDLLWDGESDEREPYFYTTQYTRGSGIGGTYIEANLSQQHVYIYIDGVMVCDTPCVSGNTSNGHGTPTGVYQILYKDTDCELKGVPLANGQYSYISHVDYWMPFYGGCGFHDASWRSSFGGTIYKYDGSHGCINLPPSIVPTFYSYVSTGMPVVVFY